MTEQALEGPLKGFLVYTDNKVLSCDFSSNIQYFTFDKVADLDLNDNFVKLISCYDNEYGNSSPMVELMACMTSK